MGIGSRLKEYIKVENVTQKSLSEILGTTPQNMSSILKEKSNLTLFSLETIANRFEDLNIRWLLCGEGEMFLFNENDRNYRKITSSNQKGPEEPKITTYSCPDCIKKENTIKDLRKTIELQDELLERYRPKKEKGCG